ncbi:peptidoglycan-binding protein [Patescibacteria group bacterium]|nr:peptidoglycan-binding protein [Patescibacteria group bacterium]
MYSNVIGKIGATVTALALAVSAFAMLAPISAQAAGCNFTRDLYVGVTGDDVRCLQVYLNGAGNARIAASGVGAPGKETTTFGPLTGQAVLRWQQANGIAGANGVFGAGSRAKYNALIGSGGGTVVTPTVPVSGAQDQIRARIAILEAIAAYQDAQDENGEEDLLEDSLSNLLNAMAYYVNNSYTQAISAANNATNDAEDAMGDSDDDDEDEDAEEDDAEEAVDELDEAIDEADDLVQDSNASQDDLEEASDLLNDARDVLDEAEEALDDEDWEDALDLADEGQDLVDEALDVVGEDASGDEDEAEEALDDAWDAFDDAWDEVNEAEDDGEDIDDAEDLLDEAEELLDEADEALDDEDWDEVLDLVEEAEDLIDEALDEI